MENKAIIKIVSNATMEKDELIEVITPGSLVKLEDEYIAKYEETEISGMKGTNTTLKIGSDYVILEREGSTSTKMHFELNKPQVSLYNTPYGMLELSIDTKELKVDFDENGGEVHIEYEMGVQGQEPLKTKLSLNIEV